MVSRQKAAVCKLASSSWYAKDDNKSLKSDIQVAFFIQRLVPLAELKHPFPWSREEQASAGQGRLAQNGADQRRAKQARAERAA